MEVSTSGKRHYQVLLILRGIKKLVNFGSLTPEIMWLMFTHPKSIVRVLRMLMHLCAGHVTLLPGKFHPSNFPHNWI